MTASTGVPSAQARSTPSWNTRSPVRGSVRQPYSEDTRQDRVSSGKDRNRTSSCRDTQARRAAIAKQHSSSPHKKALLRRPRGRVLKRIPVLCGQSRVRLLLRACIQTLPFFQSKCMCQLKEICYRTTVKVMSRPPLLLTEILPPWASTVALAMERPSPVPPVFLERDSSGR